MLKTRPDICCEVEDSNQPGFTPYGFLTQAQVGTTEQKLFNKIFIEINTYRHLVLLIFFSSLFLYLVFHYLTLLLSNCY